MRSRLQDQALHSRMKPALLRRPPPEAFTSFSRPSPCRQPPPTILSCHAPSCIASTLSSPTTQLEICFPVPSRQHPGHSALVEAGRLLPRCRYLPRPLDADAEIIHVVASDARCVRTSAFIALPTLPSLHATHPQHHPRTSRGAVVRAGGREENKSLRVLVFVLSGYNVCPMAAAAWPGYGGRRCGCDCGCGRESRCDTGMHGTGAGGGPCSVGSMLAWPRCTFWGAM
jgi:hypothetical protein